MNRIFVFALLASLGALAFAAPSLPLDGDEALLATLAQTVAMQAAASGAASAEVAPANPVAAGDSVDPVTGDSGSHASSAVADVETGLASSRLVRYIKISNPPGRSDWLSISWVACFDRTGKNVCANKHATAKTHYGNPWGNPSTPLSQTENVGQGAGNAFISGNQDNSNWWKVDLGAPFDIKEIKFRGRNDCAYVHNCPNQYAGLLITMEDKVRALCTGTLHVAAATRSLSLTHPPGRNHTHWQPEPVHDHVGERNSDAEGAGVADGVPHPLLPTVIICNILSGTTWTYCAPMRRM